MGYLTLKIAYEAQEPLFETDLPLSVFIPVVRLITRALEQRDHLQESLEEYQVIITPRYEGRPRTQEYIRPRDNSDVISTPDKDVLKITEDDIPVVDIAAYEKEIYAYYHPENSPLCDSCPERHRCPGSGLVKKANLKNWIEFDPNAMITNERIHFFTFRFEDKHGKRFFEHDFLVQSLQHLIEALTERLLQMKKFFVPKSGRNTAVLIARFSGTPRIDPLVHQVRIKPQEKKTTELVDWDSIEAERDGNGHIEVEQGDDDLEIKVIDTQETQLPLTPRPSTINLDSVGIIDNQDILIFVRRSMLHQLSQSNQQNSQGILIGSAARNPSDQKPYVKVNHFIDASEAFSEGVVSTISFELWQYVEKKLAADFEDQQIIGWYRVHLLGPALLTIQAGEQTIHATTNERLFVSKEEQFMQQSFFREEWHILLIVDPIDDRFRFYNLRHGKLTAVSGYFIV